ncbi:MAG: glycerol-3-phosphate dehydrogenase [Bauldia sp.]
MLSLLAAHDPWEGVLTGPVYDLAIIGGGINGCGIARDAAGRGLSVYLCDQNDLGSATSSASTKLIHGGLRYLEFYEFRLVHEALVEREVLLKAAPHIIRPLRFVLPHHTGLRPRWFLRLGLFLYDHLGGRKILPPTRSLDLRRDPAGGPLKPDFRFAFEYSDCWVDDARLVVLNAVDARSRGASINPRTRCRSAERLGETWRLTLEDTRTGAPLDVSARALVNAGGPWVVETLQQVIRANSPTHIRLIKGSHIVVPRLFDHDRAYIFQNADDRIVFAIPYEDDFTLIGTTDEDYEGDPADVKAESSEIDYLCAAASEYFRTPVRADSVVWTYSGVRPLHDDGASSAREVTRDYLLELDAPTGKAPLLNVFGGKITTHRRLADRALALLSNHLPTGNSWTAGAHLPGGDFPLNGADDLVRSLRDAYPFVAEKNLRRLVRSYGTRAAAVLNGARNAEDLGRRFGAELTQAEVDYLIAEEWAGATDDILWRRSKLGLHLDRKAEVELEAYMQSRAATPRAAARAVAP